MVYETVVYGACLTDLAKETVVYGACLTDLAKITVVHGMYLTASSPFYPHPFGFYLGMGKQNGGQNMDTRET